MFKHRDFTEKDCIRGTGGDLFRENRSERREKNQAFVERGKLWDANRILNFGGMCLFSILSSLMGRAG